MGLHTHVCPGGMNRAVGGHSSKTVPRTAYKATNTNVGRDIYKI
jgi:hypothetical protein